MNYKLEKFWNLLEVLNVFSVRIMNYKLEKFWNKLLLAFNHFKSSMNYKLEKFWNLIKIANVLEKMEWTINLKSFEIVYNLL